MEVGGAGVRMSCGKLLSSDACGASKGGRAVVKRPDPM